MSLEQAKKHAHRALEIAEQLGDIVEIAEICFTFARYYKLRADYPMAIDYCKRVMTLAESIGVLELQNYAYSTQDELLTLLEVDASELRKCEKRQIEIAQKIGNIYVLFSVSCKLAKLLILSGNIQEAEQQLH